jgi:uncharacterized protein YndB with AHSA1/START domain
MTPDPSSLSPLAPLRREVLVGAGRPLAFEVFTRRIGAWWPLGEFSVHGTTATVAFDGEGVGARIVESLPGAEDAVWGTVTRWDPADALAFTWHPGRGPDGAGEVSVTFEDAGDVGDATLVRLEHTGWEAYGDRAAAARTEYGHGWPVVLDAYAASVVSA